MRTGRRPNRPAPPCYLTDACAGCSSSRSCPSSPGAAAGRTIPPRPRRRRPRRHRARTSTSSRGIRRASRSTTAAPMCTRTTRPATSRPSTTSPRSPPRRTWAGRSSSPEPRSGFRMSCAPRFDYGRASHAVEVTPAGAVFESGGTRLVLHAGVPLEQVGDDVVASFELEEGDVVGFVLETAGDGPRPVEEGEVLAALEGTVGFWRSWLAGSTYRGRWREMVNRSAITLKLLTYAPTGALIAAATAGLPEQLGGERNWDYRFTWIRDSSFSVRALLGLGFTEEAGAARPLGRGPGARIRSRRRSRPAEDHVPGRRLLRPRRGDPRSLQRLQGIAPGADRQRGCRPDAAGHLRRVRRLRLRGRPAGCAARQLRRRPDVRPGPQLAVRELGPARRGHLGDTRR